MRCGCTRRFTVLSLAHTFPVSRFPSLLLASPSPPPPNPPSLTADLAAGHRQTSPRSSLVLLLSFSHLISHLCALGLEPWPCFSNAMAQQRCLSRNTSDEDLEVKPLGAEANVVATTEEAQPWEAAVVEPVGTKNFFECGVSEFQAGKCLCPWCETMVRYDFDLDQLTSVICT